jgi:hydrogenase expression/formation protein HypD
MGYTEYQPPARHYQHPIVVTGFEPPDIWQGVYMCVKQLEEGRAALKNQYTRSVQRGGNQSAQQLVPAVFRVVQKKVYRWQRSGVWCARCGRPCAMPTYTPTY